MEEFFEGIETNKYNYNIHRVNIGEFEGIRWDYFIETTDKNGEQIDCDSTHYLKDARVIQKMMIKYYEGDV